MRIPKIYLETSVFNFYFADDAPNERAHTLQLFREIAMLQYKPYTSSFVVAELMQAPQPKRQAMVDLIERYGVMVLPETPEAERLAALYVAEGIIPKKYMTDAIHIAMTTVNDLDFIVSYNFKHIVKMKTILMTELVNLRERYRRIGIYSPTEVVDYD